MCPNCKGLGKQIFHRSFYSFIGKCNFCDGEGTKEAFDKVFAAKVRLESGPGSLATAVEEEVKGG